MFNVIVIDPIEQNELQKFVNSESDFNFDYEPNLKAEELALKLQSKNYDAIIVGSKDIYRNAIEIWRKNNVNKKLCIIRAGSEPSHIDYAAALEFNVVVMNVAGANKDPIIKYVLDRIDLNDNSKNVTIIGMGAIGSGVAEKLVSLGFNVTGYSPNFSADKANQLNIKFADNQIAAALNADYLVVTSHYVDNISATNVNKILGKEFLKSSDKFISSDVINNLNDNAVFINPSRPWVIDNEAIINAVKSSKLSKAFYNTGPDDYAKLQNKYPELQLLENVSMATSGTFLTEESKVLVAVNTLDSLKKFLKNGIITLPVFNLPFVS